MAPQQGFPARMPQQGFVAPQQRFMIPQQFGAQPFASPVQQDVQGPQVAYARTFIPHKNLPRPGFATPQQIARPGFVGSQPLPQAGFPAPVQDLQPSWAPQPAFVQPGFVQPEFVQPEFVQPQAVLQPGSAPQPAFAQPGFVQPQAVLQPSSAPQSAFVQPGFVQPQTAIHPGVSPQPQPTPAFGQPGLARPSEFARKPGSPFQPVAQPVHQAPASEQPFAPVQPFDTDKGLLAPAQEEALPWRRPRSSSVQVPRKPPSPWAPASRDRSLDSQREAEVDAQPWTKKNVKLKKAPRPKKTFEKEQPHQVDLKPSKIEKRPIPREKLEEVDLKPGQRIPKEVPEQEGVTLKPVQRTPKDAPERNGVALKPVPKREREVTEPEEAQLKPTKRQSRPRTRPGEAPKSPQSAQPVDESPSYQPVDDDNVSLDRSLDRSLDGSLDRSIDESLDEDFWKPKVCPWSSEPVVLKKTQRKRKVFKKEELEEVHLKPAKIEVRRLSKSELEHVDLRPVPQEQMGILSWTEEEEASLLKIDREEIEQYKQRPRSRSRDLLSETSETSDLKSLSEPIPWSHDAIHLKKAPRERQKEYPKETLEEVYLKPAIIEKKEIPHSELEQVDLHHVEKEGVVSWAEEDDSSMLKLDREELEMYKRRPRSRSRDLLDESEADDTSMSIDLSLEDILDNRRGPVPWTEEPITLKKTPREIKEIPKETLEQVQLKPSKIEKKEIPKEELEHVDLKPGQKLVKEVPKPEQVQLKPIPRKKKDDDKPDSGVQRFSETDDASILQLDRQVEIAETKQAGPDFLQMLTDTEKADVPFFWKRGAPAPEVVEIRNIRSEDTAVKELEQSVLRFKEEEQREKYSELEDAARLEVERTLEEQRKRATRPRPVPLEEQKPEPVPWTQEAVRLKQTPREKKEIPKETLEEVDLKPTKITSRQIPKDKLESVELKPTSKDTREAEKPVPFSLKPIPRPERPQVEDASKVSYSETDDTNLLNLDRREELTEKTQAKQEIGVMWERGKKKQTIENISEVEDSNLLVLDKEEITTERKEESAVMWRRGKKETVQKVVETEDTSLLALDRKETTELKRLEETAVMWERGKKKQVIEEKSETEDTSILKISHDVDETNQQKQPFQEVEDVSLLDLQKSEEKKVKITKKPLPKDEKPNKPVPWTQQAVQLKKTTRERKEIPKETLEIVDLKPSKPIKRDITKEELEHVDLAPIERKPIETKKGDTIDLKPLEVSDSTAEIVHEKTLVRTKMVKTKDTSLPYSEVEDLSLLKVDTDQDISVRKEAPEEIPVMWSRGKKRAVKQEETGVQQISEVDDTALLKLEKEQESTLKQKEIEETPVMWERGKKKPKAEKVREVEDSALLQVDKTEDILKTQERPEETPVMWQRGKKQVKPQDVQKVSEVEDSARLDVSEDVVEEDKSPETPVMWKRGKKTPKPESVPVEETKDMPWTQGIQLKRTPKQKKEIPKESVEEVQLKPAKRPSLKPEEQDVVDLRPVEKAPDVLPREDKPVEEIQTVTELVQEEKEQKKKPKREPVETKDVPWTQEAVKLKRTPKQIKEVPKETVETVELKPFQKTTTEIPREIDEVPKAEPMSVRRESIPKVEDVTEEKLPWKRTPKQKQVEQQPEEVEMKRGPRRPKPEDEETPEVALKPIKPRPKEEEEKPEVVLKPWKRTPKDTPVEQPEEVDIKRAPRRPKPEEETAEVALKPIKPRLKDEEEKPEVVLKPWKRGPKETPVEQPEEVDIKRAPRRPKHEEETPEVALKPIKPTPKEEEKPEVVLKPWKRGPKEAPVEQPEEVDIKRAPRRPKPEEETPEVALKPIKPTPKEEEKPEVVLKPWKRGPKEAPVEQPEEVDIKRAPRRPKPEEETPEVALKPIKPTPKEEEKPEVVLKPWKRGPKETPAEQPEEVDIKRAPRRPKPEEETPEVALKPIKQRPKDEEEKPEVVLKPWKRGPKETPVEQPEEVDIKRAPRRPKPEEETPEVALKPIKQRPKDEEEKPEVVLKPWKRSPKDTPEQPEVPHAEQVHLKPALKRKPSEDKIVERSPEKPAPQEEVQPRDEETPVPWQRGKPRQEEIVAPEVVELKRTPRQKPKVEEEKEAVQLKPVRRIRPEEKEKEQIELKPIDKDQPEEVSVPDTEEAEPLKLLDMPEEKTKTVAVKPKPVKRVTIKEPAEEIHEVEVKREEGQEDQLIEEITDAPQPVPWKRGKKPERKLDETESVTLQPVPRRPKEKEIQPEVSEVSEAPIEPLPVEDEQPKPWRRGSKPKREIVPEEEKQPEQVVLKPVKRGPKPEIEEKEEVNLKPIIRIRPKKEEQKEETTSVLVEDVPSFQETTEVKLKPKKHKRRPEKEEVPEQPSQPEELPVEAPEEVVELKELEKPEVRAPKPSKPAEEEQPKEEAKPSWRRKRIRIPKPVPGRPDDEEVEEKPELVATQVTEEQVEQVQQESRSETVVTLSKRETVKAKSRPQPSEEAPELEEQPIWQQQMSVETQSRKVTRRAGQFIQEDSPLRDLEIVTARRGVDKMPEEPVLEEEIREDKTTVRRSIVQRSTAEILAPQKTKPPKFTKRLEPVATEPDSPAKFVCQVEGVPFPELTWLYNGKELRATEHVAMTVVENTVTLEISKTLPQHVGVYSCKASNPAGVAMSTANLVILEKEESGVAPQFTQPLKPQVVKPKETATLRCLVRGEPTPLVRWYRGDQEVKPDATRRLSFDQRTGTATMTLLEPTPDDETIYRVVATNKFGRAECRANLILGEQVAVTKPEVMHAPRITEPLKAVLAVKGAPVLLTADYQGTPQPEVRWYRNGKEIVPGADKDKEIVTTPSRTELHIPSVTKQHSGKYEVRAMNPAGEARTSGSVAVRERDDEEMKDVRAPRFIEPLQPQIVAEGECVILEARVDSYPTCSFQWFLHSVPVKSSPELRIVTEENRSVLVVREVLPEHSGDYTCRAENVVGSVTSTATLSVLPDTDWEHTAELEMVSPQFVQPTTSLKVMDGEKVTFTCQVVGKPTPRVTWRHNGQPIKEAKDVVIYQDQEGLCKLAISEVFPEDAGLYTCEALNSVGEAVCTASLVVEAYEYVPDSEIASVAVDLNLATAEEDLLDKESLSSLEDQELQAPHFVTPLVQATPSREGELVRLEVKAVGNPKPTVRWYKQGAEIQPNKDFQVENFEDGTSVLTIMEIFPDDVGEISCEVQNELGVDQTVTELQVHSILGTKEYRKPEWVTQMEELKDALKAVQAVPSIEVELRDTYVEELDTVVFECVYSGTPKPDIIWYHDDQIVRNTEKVKISIQESKTTCTVKYTNLEDAGIYVCKATSDIGMAITKAKLSVNELDEERKADKTIQIAQEEEEKIKMEKVKLDKKREKKKRTPRWGLTEGRDHISVEEVQVVESTDTFVETVDTATAHRRQSIQDSVSTSAIASCKKVDEPKPSEKPEGRAQSVLPEREGVSVSEAIPDHTAKEILLDKKPKQRKAKLSESEQLEEAKVTIVKVEEIIRTQKVKMAKEVEDIMELMNAREFGPGESPLRELAQIGFLVRHGVSVRDIESVYHETDQFPALRTPAAQSALVSLVEREGHGTLISQVLTEETTADETTVAKTVGFRAFMRMIELRHVTVEEVLTHFSPQDFQMPVWETTEASKVETTHLSTVKVTQRTKVLTDHKEIVKKRTTRHEDEIEETLEEIKLKSRSEVVTQEHLLQTRDDSLTISEIPEDIPAETTEMDNAIVTLPDDDFKQTSKSETPVNVAKTDTLVQKRKTKIKKSDQKSSETEEIEVEIIGGGRKIIKRTIRAQMPDITGEYIEEDFVGDVRPDDKIKMKGLPLFSPSQMSQAIPSEIPAQILTGQDVPQDRAKVTLLPHMALSKEEVQPQEREINEINSALQSVKASENQDFIEPVSVIQPHVETIPANFAGTFKPQTFEASQSLVHNEGIVVSETRVDQSTVETETSPQQSVQASVSVTQTEAASVTEIETSDRETVLATRKEPQKLHAERLLDTNETYSVLEVYESLREDNLDSSLKTQGIKPKLNISANESLLVSEVFSETKPGQYVPELIVATETATKSVLAQHPLTTSEMQAPEVEGTFVPGRLPPSQQASHGIRPVEAAITSALAVQEKEGDLAVSRQPEESQASEDFTTQEGVLVSQTHIQDSEVPFAVETADTKVVDVGVLQQQSIVSLVTTSVENEQPFTHEETPNTKTAITSINCLETSGVSSPVKLEVESEFIPGKIPSAAMAETSLREEESVGVIEVQTNEAPADFTGHLKYNTDEAVSSVELSAATEITEIISQDKESTLKLRDEPSLCTIETGYRNQFSVSVFEAQSGEKEENLIVYDLPDSHKGKRTPTHPVVSLQVEEVCPEGNLSLMKEELPKMETATSERDTHTEMVVQEAVPSESAILSETTPLLDSKRADVVMVQSEATTSTEVFTQDKEGVYKEPLPPKEFFAQTDVTGQNIPVTSEVLPQYSADDLDSVPAKTEKAKEDHTTVEGLIITQSELVEKEDSLPQDIIPSSKTASIQLPEHASGICVEDIVPHEMEADFLPQITPKPVSAGSSFPLHEVALQSIVLAEHTSQDLPDTMAVTGKAKPENQPLNELIVTEMAVGDSAKDLSADIRPSTHTAEVLLGTKESVTLTEVILDSETSSLPKETAPKPRTASLDVTAHEVAQQEETVLDHKLGDWKRVSPIKETASAEHDGLQIAVLTQTSTGEKEGECLAEAEPFKHKADILYEDASQAVSVKETHLQDTEGLLNTVEAPRTQKATSEILSQGVAETNEITSHIGTGEVKCDIPDSVRATPGHLPFQTLTVGLTQTSETEGQYLSESRPDSKLATAMYEEELGISVSITTSQEREGPLSDFKIPSQRAAVPEVLAHEIAQQLEVVPAASVDGLLISSPVSAQANVDQTLHRSLVATETAPNEKESFLAKQIQPATKTADLLYPEDSPVVVTETFPQDSEALLEETSAPEARFAHTTVGSHEVATKTEITAESSVREFAEVKETYEHATHDQVPYQTIVQSVTAVEERESLFEDKPTIETKTANTCYEETKSVNVLEVVSEDKEDKLSLIESPLARRADFNISPQEVAVNLETRSHFSLSDMKDQVPLQVQALTEHVPFESLQQSEAVVQETEMNFDTVKSQPTKLASISLDEVVSLSVAAVEVDEKEALFELPTQPKEQVAVPDILGKEAASQFFITPETSTGTFVKQEPSSSVATSQQMPSEHLLTTEISVSEKELEFSDKKLDHRLAEVEFEEEKTVVVSEITLAEKEIKYASPDMPKSRTALPFITEAIEVAENLQVLPEMALADLTSQIVKEDHAAPGQETFQCVQVSQEQAHENGIEFSDKFSPAVKQASIFVEEGKSVNVVSQVEPIDKESAISSWEAPAEKRAFPEVSGHEIAEKSEVLTGLCLGDIFPEEIKTGKATVDQLPLQSIQMTEALPSEKESNFSDFPQSVSSSAKLILEEQTGLQVSEVGVTDKESVYETPEKPKFQNAHPDVSAKEATEITTVLSQQSVDDITTALPILATAKTERSSFESLQRTEPIVAEHEQPLLESLKRPATNANVSLEEHGGITVSVVESHEKEDNLPESEIPTSRKALADIDSKEVAETLEVRVGYVPEDMEIVPRKKVSATVTQSLLESIVLQETAVQETETTLEKGSLPAVKNASIKIDEQPSLRVSQVTTEDKTDHLETLEIPKGKCATSEVVSQEGVVTTVVDSQMHSVQKDEPFVLHFEKAHHGQEPKEAITVTEGNVQEKEGSVQDKAFPQERTAEVNIEGKLSATISAVLLQETEENRQDESRPHKQVAHVNVTGQDVAEQLEVITQQGTENLRTEKPSEATAVQAQSTMEALLQSQLILHEKETELTGGKPYGAKSALVIIEGSQSAAIATQIIPEDKEGMCITTDTPSKQNAKIDIHGREIAEKSVVFPVQTTTDISDTAISLKKYASAQQSPFESLTQSETPVHECEDALADHVSPNQSTAKIQFETGKSLNVTEIITEDKEGFVTQTNPKGEVAQSDVCERETALQTVTVPDMNIAPLSTNFPDLSKAKTTLPQESHGLIVTEHSNVGEVETILPALVKPSSKTIPFTLEEHDSKLIVTQVQHEQKEEILKNIPAETRHATERQTETVLYKHGLKETEIETKSKCHSSSR